MHNSVFTTVTVCTKLLEMLQKPCLFVSYYVEDFKSNLNRFCFYVIKEMKRRLSHKSDVK